MSKTNQAAILKIIQSGRPEQGPSKAALQLKTRDIVQRMQLAWDDYIRKKINIGNQPDPAIPDANHAEKVAAAMAQLQINFLTQNEQLMCEASNLRDDILKRLGPNKDIDGHGYVWTTGAEDAMSQRAEYLKKLASMLP